MKCVGQLDTHSSAFPTGGDAGHYLGAQTFGACKFTYTLGPYIHLCQPEMLQEWWQSEVQIGKNGCYHRTSEKENNSDLNFETQLRYKPKQNYPKMHLLVLNKFTLQWVFLVTGIVLGNVIINSTLLLGFNWQVSLMLLSKSPFVYCSVVHQSWVLFALKLPAPAQKKVGFHLF